MIKIKQQEQSHSSLYLEHARLCLGHNRPSHGLTLRGHNSTTTATATATTVLVPVL